jgi:drug/metabolite transporter (DMT)-like permease
MDRIPKIWKVRLVFGLLCLIWGTTWMAIRVLVHEVPPLRAAALRFVIGVAVLGPLIWIRRAAMPRKRGEWRVIVLLGLTIQALPFGLLFWAEQYVTSAMTAVLYSSAPLIVALLTPWMTGRSVPRAALYSLLVAIGGIAFLFQVDLRATPQTLAGGLMIMVAVLSSAFSVVLAKRELAGVDPAISTIVQLLIGAGLLFAASAVIESTRSSDWSRSSVLALIFLGVFGSAVAFVSYYWLLNHIPAYKASTINLVVPFVSMLEASLILRELITLPMFVASVVVLGAVAFALLAPPDHPTELRLSGTGDHDRL